MKAASASHEQPRPKAGANQTVTWGELFLLFRAIGNDAAAAHVLQRIMELDAA